MDSAITLMTSHNTEGIAAGPQAERLSDGNYLYLYNIDNAKNCQSASCGSYLSVLSFGPLVAFGVVLEHWP
jgi:hypothetical protein